MVLLLSVLVGKAREVYSVMGVEHSGQYDYVKQVVLKVHELVPEAYRQNFWNCKIQDKHTYTEFVRDKEALSIDGVLLRKWLRILRKFSSLY